MSWVEIGQGRNFHLYLIFPLSPTCCEDYLFYENLLQSCILQMLHSCLRLCNLNSAPRFGESSTLKMLDLAVVLCLVSACLLRVKVTELLQAIVQTFLNTSKIPSLTPEITEIFLWILRLGLWSLLPWGDLEVLSFSWRFLLKPTALTNPAKLSRPFTAAFSKPGQVCSWTAHLPVVEDIIRRPEDHLLCGFQTQES